MTLPMALFGSLGPTELIIIGVIALLVFGPQLPKAARWLGKSVNEFKRSMSEVADEVTREPSDRPAESKPEEKPQDKPPAG